MDFAEKRTYLSLEHYRETFEDERMIGLVRNSALVAVSTGLLRLMNKNEVEAVLGHEVSHIANGDMVTLTLIQGVALG